MANVSDDPLNKLRILQFAATIQRDKTKALDLEAQAGAMVRDFDIDELRLAQRNAASIQQAGWDVAEFPTLTASGAWEGSPAYAQEQAQRIAQAAKLDAQDFAGAVAVEAQLVAQLAGRWPNVALATMPMSRLNTAKTAWTAAQFPTLARIGYRATSTGTVNSPVVSSWPDQPPASASTSTTTNTGTSTNTSTTTGTVVSTWPDQIPVDAAGVPVNSAAAAALYAQLTGQAQASTANSGDAVPAASETPSSTSRVLPWLLAAAGIAAAKYF